MGDSIPLSWAVSVGISWFGVCPTRGERSTHRYGWHERDLQDLPAQGASVMLKLRMAALALLQQDV